MHLGIAAHVSSDLQVEDDVLAGADEQQAAMMAERVILIDDNDNVIGHASKKECKCILLSASVGKSSSHTSAAVTRNASAIRFDLFAALQPTC